MSLELAIGGVLGVLTGVVIFQKIWKPDKHGGIKTIIRFKGEDRMTNISTKVIRFFTSR